jgi:hypothetical protein
VHEVGIVLEAMELGNYKEALVKKKIDGKCLMECYTVEDVKEMGISLVVKARVFLNEVMIWKANGVPMEYFSVYQVDNDAEVMIAELTKGFHRNTQLSSRTTEPRKFVGRIRSLIGNAESNDNDPLSKEHEESVVDDTSFYDDDDDDNDDSA